MSWAFGSIDFDTYGVKVAKSAGVLDLPKLKHDGHDWLDEDGRDYWRDSAEYNNREIILNCWIMAEADAVNSGYDNFQTKVNAFTAAVKAEGKSTLTTPFLNIADCSISQGVFLTRETNYVQDIQAGTFLLKITVHGDSDFELVNIYRDTGTNVVAVVKSKDLKVTKILQGAMNASLSFESNELLDIEYFDFIMVNSNGVDDDRFHIETEPEFKKISTNKYRYSLKLDHQLNWLSHSMFLYDGESDFYFWGDLEDILDLIITNHGRSGYNKFSKGTVATTENRNHKFSNENCLQVLKRICSEYELEYEFEYQAPVTYDYLINVKEQVANTKALTFQYGKGNGLYELTREPMLKEKLCTILYAYGAAKNLKPDYRGGMTRLSFDGNPLKQNESMATGYGPHEKVVYFDDIYPGRSATVTGYLQVLESALTDAQREIYPGGIYRVEDTTLDFDLNDYLLGGLTAKIRMKTGNLAGFEFQIEYYDHDVKQMWIIPFKDERGEQFPNASLQIAIGDEYTLVDIDQPTTYVSAAESDLEAAATSYLSEHSTPKFPYRCRVDPAFMDDAATGLEVGEHVTVQDTDYDISGQFRISELVYNSHTGVYELKLSEKAILSRLQQTNLRLQALERAAEDTGADEVESMRKDKETAEELRTRMTDPADDLLAADRIVRSESIDPRMLAYDSGTVQFSLQNALISANVDGNEDKVKIEAGTITMHNFRENTKDRYQIHKLKSVGGDYDPTRTWNIVETEFTLATKDNYWMYVKLDMSTGSTSCEVIVSDEHIEGKMYVEDGYIIYKLADISAGTE